MKKMLLFSLFALLFVGTSMVAHIDEEQVVYKADEIIPAGEGESRQVDGAGCVDGVCPVVDVPHEKPVEDKKAVADHPEDHLRTGYDRLYNQTHPLFVWAGGKNELGIGFMDRCEGFYADSINLLSGSSLDQILYFQNTADLKFFYHHGDLLRMRWVARNKYRAGDAESLGQTSKSTIRIGDVDGIGEHNHFLGKLFFWIREGWIELNLNEMLNIDETRSHHFKFGIFSFELGRGIALGDAYAVSPGLLNFYSNNVVDQYAFGWLLHGDIVRGALTYDFYTSILRNLSDNFGNVNAKVFRNEIGRQDNPQRGFGKINFVLAARLIWGIKDLFCCPSLLRMEPYIFYNHDPEQRIEFPSDASSSLNTLGWATEYEGKVFEWGFDMAVNMGHQDVRGWDRNAAEFANRDGVQSIVYNAVLTGKPGAKGTEKALVTSANKKIASSSPQGEAFNGKEIGSSGLYNDRNRYRNAYTNLYRGSMFVADLGIRVRDNVKVTFGGGIATGDENPNRPVDDPNDSSVDGVFLGFIPFQSIYSGKRVQSLFFLGSGRIARPLSLPPTLSDDSGNTGGFASTDSGFTNLKLLGWGADVYTSLCCAKTRLRPNILFGWQQHATKAFDISTLRSSTKFASTYLGFEINLLADIFFTDQLRGYLIGGLFFPGSHFDDIRGKPLSPDGLEALKNPGCGGTYGRGAVPVLGTHRALLLNGGIEYSF